MGRLYFGQSRLLEGDGRDNGGGGAGGGSGGGAGGGGAGGRGRAGRSPRPPSQRDRDRWLHPALLRRVAWNRRRRQPLWAPAAVCESLPGGLHRHHPRAAGNVARGQHHGRRPAMPGGCRIPPLPPPTFSRHPHSPSTPAPVSSPTRTPAPVFSPTRCLFLPTSSHSRGVVSLSDSVPPPPLLPTFPSRNHTPRHCARWCPDRLLPGIGQLRPP